MLCCPNSPSRQIPRDVHEDARDATRRLMRSKAFLKSRDQRKRVEMRFAHLRIHHGFDACGCEGFLVHATSSFSPPPCRTSRPGVSSPWSTTRPAARIAFLNRLRPRRSRRPSSGSQPTAGLFQPHQNYLNSITPNKEPPFSTPSTRSRHRCPRLVPIPCDLLKVLLAVMDTPRALDLIHVSAPKTIRAT